MNNILKTGFFGCFGILAASLLLFLLSIIFFDLGGWIDGIPFGLIAAIPGGLLGGLIGAVIGFFDGLRNEKLARFVFLDALIGALIGAVISYSIIKPFLI